MKHANILKNIFVLLLFALVTPVLVAQPELNTISFKNKKQVRKYFAYTGDGSIIISGHRGGREPGFPENSIQGLGNVLHHLPAIFEIDPRLTKDSVIVLMHDATLDRTTTGKGKLSAVTYDELQQIRLRDFDGNPTDIKVPTLEDVMIWARGKTVINLDKKDVPLWMIVDLIKKHKAEQWVMVTVHNGQEARYYYENLPGVMMSAFVRNWAEYQDISRAGVPWENMIVYVGPTMKPEYKEMYDLLHAKGVRCMVSFSPTHDKYTDKQKRINAYATEVALKPDIIESDIPTEIWSVIKK
ncbi:MAG: glycerophosphodiester phosphodiesterase family protein [Bacteroidales bacterium]